MNKWVKKSIELANSSGYFDRLFNIYPIELGKPRIIYPQLQEKVKEFYQRKDKVGLVKALLKLPKFPIDHPYVASIRKYPYLIERNPMTVERIAERILKIDIDTLYELISRPKSPSRQLGSCFKNWLKTLGYPYLGEGDFMKSEEKIVFLKGSDQTLKDFAQNYLKIAGLEKGLDFILKVRDTFVLGEAKFLTDYGGSQNNQFDYATKVAKIDQYKIIGIAILDGIVWFKSNAYMHQTVRKLDGVALSALLLQEFITELAKKG